MNNQVLSMLIEEYVNMKDNISVSEEYKQGYLKAVETICARVFGEEEINLLINSKRGVEDGKVSGSEENM